MRGKWFVLAVVVFVPAVALAQATRPMTVHKTGLAPTRATDENELRRARQLEGLGRYGEAFGVYRNLFFRSPKSQIYLEGALRCLKRLKNEDRLLDFLQSALQVSPGNYFILSELASVRYRQGAKEEALQIWRGAVEQAGSDARVYRAVASAMLENGLREEAVDLYLEARKRFDNPSLFTFELANLYLAERNYRAATREYVNYIRSNPQSYSFVESSISGFLEEPEMGEAIVEELRKAVARNPGNLGLHALLGGVLLRMRRYDEAFEEFLKVEDLRPSQDGRKASYGQHLLRVAEAAMRGGDLATAQKAFETILQRWERSPYAMRARLGLADVLAKRREVSRAYEAYLDFAKQYQASSHAPMALYRAVELLRGPMGQPERARKIAGDLMKRYPRSRWGVEAGILLAEMDAAAGNYQDAGERLGQVAELAADRWPDLRELARFKQAELLFFQSKWDSALALLEELARPQAVSKGEGQYANDAIDLMMLIRTGRMVDPSALKAIAAARELFERGAVDSAVTLLHQRAQASAASPLADRLWFELGVLADSTGDHQLAAEAFGKVVREFPSSLLADVAQYRLGLCLEALGDTSAAREAFELLLTNYPKSVYLEAARRRLRSIAPKG